MRHSLRRVLLVATIAVLAIVLPSLTGQAQSAPPKPHLDRVPLTPDAAPAQPGWHKDVPQDANLVGVQWTGDSGSKFTIEVRKGSSSDWTPISDVARIDNGPDNGTREATHAAKTNVSEPVWTGNDVTAVRVRLDGGSAQDVTLQAVKSKPAQTTATHQALVVGRGFGWALLAGAGITLLVRRRRLLVLLAAGSLALTGCFGGGGGGGASIPDQIISHDSWGGDLPWNWGACPEGPQYAGFVNRAIVHHTVNSNDYGPGDSASMIRGIYAYHVYSLGYCDIAYNFIIDKYGQVFEGRYGGIASTVIGAHALNWNTGSTGISLLGTYSSFTPPPDTLNSLINLISWKFKVHNVDPGPDDAILGHRDTFSTECPGQAAYDQIPGIRAAVRFRAPYNSPFGNLDGIERTGNTVRVTGWAIDRDIVYPIKVRVAVDYQTVAEVAADRPRPDVEQAFPLYGPNHGFDISVNVAPGPHPVHVFAMNVGGGAPYTLLGSGTA